MITKAELIKELGSQANLARAAGVSRQAVNQWREIIPMSAAYQLSKTGRWRFEDMLSPDVAPRQ